MDIKEFNSLIVKKQKELEDFLRTKAPVLVGNAAVNHIKGNFREGGFMNGGRKPWPATKRQQRGSPYKPLLSGRNHLMSNTTFRPRDYAVTIVNSTPYAGIHNEGGTINTHPTVTPKMRKYAWAQYYKAGGGKEKTVPDDAQFWKRLALTKKTKLNIRVRIPQRRFMGKESPELQKEVRDVVVNGISKIMNL